MERYRAISCLNSMLLPRFLKGDFLFAVRGKELRHLLLRLVQQVGAAARQLAALFKQGHGLVQRALAPLQFLYDLLQPVHGLLEAQLFFCRHLRFSFPSPRRR